MDVTALSVSVNVDISAFIDAMDRMGAMMMAVADEFEDVAQDIAKSFSGINTEGEKNKSFWDNFKGGFWEFVEAATKVKDLIELIGLAYGRLKPFMVAVSEVGIAEVFEGIAVAAVDLLTPVGWVIDAVAILGVAWYALSGSSSGASSGIQSMTNDMKKLGDKTLVANQNYHDLQDATSGGVSSNAALLASKSYKFPDSNLTTGDGEVAASNSVAIPAIKPATDKVASDNDETKQQSLFDKFIGRYQDYYEKLKSLSAPTEITMRIKAIVSYDNTNGNTNADTNIQSIAPSSSQNVPTSQAGGLADGTGIVPVQGIQASTNAIKEYKEGLDEAAQAQKGLQNIAVAAFLDIGDALGEMMAGQKKINPLAVLMKQMGDAFKQYAAFLISAGTTMLFGGDPMGGPKLAEGIGLEAVGTAMGAIKMAQGGVVSGSTFANIGEYAGASHNPEVVAPLDKLRNMLGGGNNNHQFSFQIAGDNLLSIQDRVQNNSQFVMGTNNQ